jgi:hypothetical protein
VGVELNVLKSKAALRDYLLYYDNLMEIHNKIHQLFIKYVLSRKYVTPMPTIKI